MYAGTLGHDSILFCDEVGFNETYTHCGFSCSRYGSGKSGERQSLFKVCSDFKRTIYHDDFSSHLTSTFAGEDVSSMERCIVG